MPARDADRVARLRGLGLTEYQAKGYAALARLGRATAAQLARVTDVPRNKLYPAMQELSALGLAETALGEAQVYRPLPLDAFVAERAGALRAEAARLDAARAALQAELGGGPGGAPAAYRLYLGRARTLEQLRAAIDGARTRLDVVASPGSPARMLASGEAARLRERADEGVAVRMVVAAPSTLPGAEALAALQALLGERVRAVARPGLACVLLAADGALAVQVQLEPDDASVAEGGDVGLVSASPLLAGVVEEHAGLLWDRVAPGAARAAARGGVASEAGVP